MAATDERGWDAVAEWYHGFFTGMVLSAIWCLPSFVASIGRCFCPG